MASICRNVPDDRPYHPAGPHEFEVTSHYLEQLDPVQDDRELFPSALSVFPHVGSEVVIKFQHEEFGEYFDYLTASPDSSAKLPPGESPNTMSQFFLHEEALFRSYVPGHLRKRNTFRDQLVLPSSLRSLVLNACHDSPASGGHLAFKATFDKIRDRYWWPSLGKDVAEHIRQCVACRH